MLNPDIFFLSYTESNAEINWQNLVARFPMAKRLHGISGLKKAHALLSIVSSSDFYFVVDGDNQIHPNFDFSLSFQPQKNSLYVWRAKNPVNQLEYGYGGIKLYNRWLFENAGNSGPDLATTIAPVYVPVMQLASTTYFNSSPLEAWRGAFRECVKLQLNIYKNPMDQHSKNRLSTWLSTGQTEKNGNWCLLGAQQGKLFAEENRSRPEKLQQINDFLFLNKLFSSQQAFVASDLPQG